MLSKKELETKILKTLEKHGVLNTMAICRTVNGFHPNNYQICHQGMVFGANRGWDKLCSHIVNECKYDYRDVHRGLSSGALARLLKRGLVQTEKMRFWDKGKSLPTDTFRFWFINRKEFEDKILRQTLIPYIQTEGVVE